MAPLEIAVAGGGQQHCDFLLGNATIKVSVPGCSWPGEQFSQATVYKNYNYTFPAQKLQFQVTSVSYLDGRGPIQSINAYFDDPSRIQTIDLTEDAERRAMAQTYEDEDQKENPDSTSDLYGDMYEPPAIRFQFDGTLDMEIDIYGHSSANFDSRGDAYPSADWECSDPPPDTALLQKNPNQNPSSVLDFSWKATLYYDIETCDGMQRCNDAMFDEDGAQMRVNVTSEVGIDYIQNPPFDEWAQQLSNKDQNNLNRCSPKSPCTELVSDSNYDNVTYSYAEGSLYAGRPNIDPPFTKPLTFQVVGHDVRKEIDCIVTGAFGDSPYLSIEVPEYLPIMILRDPPGSGSYGERDFLPLCVCVCVCFAILFRCSFARACCFASLVSLLLTCPTTCSVLRECPNYNEFQQGQQRLGCRR